MFGGFFLCLRCPSKMLVADVVVMAAVVDVNVVVGIVKPLYPFRHIYVYIIKLSNWVSVLACGCLWSVVLFSLPFQSLSVLLRQLPRPEASCGCVGET